MLGLSLSALASPKQLNQDEGASSQFVNRLLFEILKQRPRVVRRLPQQRTETEIGQIQTTETCFKTCMAEVRNMNTCKHICKRN